MRPTVADIAVPEFPKGMGWENVAFLRVEKLVGRQVPLVHFFDFAHLSSLRALDYVRAWHERYADAGLRVIGVHSPRFAFGSDPEAVGAAVRRLGIDWAIAIDADFEVWRDYGNEGWPALYLFDRQGALCWLHFGEGEYAGTEQAIQEALAELDPDFAPPALMAPLRPGEDALEMVIAPTPESFPGGSESEPWLGDGRRRLEVPYEGASAHAVLDGEGALAYSLDGSEQAAVAVTHPGLYALAEHPGHEAHTLSLLPAAGVRVHALSHAPAAAR